MAKKPLTDAPEIEIASLADLRRWLSANFERTAGVWLIIYKKSSGPKYVAISDIIDELLCYGWVDSLPRAKDETRSMLYVAPRNPKSNWSRVNKNKIARLSAENRIKKSGQTIIDEAKKSGTWTALDDVEDLVIPPDLQAAFDDLSGSETNWQAFPRSVKRGALEVLLNAKRAETRMRKIDTIASDAAVNRRPFQWGKK